MPRKFLDDCADACRTGADACVRASMDACMDAAPTHLETYRALDDCAELLSATARLIERGSPIARPMAAACANVCAHCAQLAVGTPGLEACAATLRECAAACRIASEADVAPLVAGLAAGRVMVN